MSLEKLRKITPHLDIESFEMITVGERGQVVIPANIRRKLKLKPGDKLICALRAKRFIGMIRMSDVSSITKMLDKMISGHKIIK